MSLKRQDDAQPSDQDLDAEEQFLMQKLQDHTILVQEMMAWKGRDKSEMHKYFFDNFPQYFARRRQQKITKKCAEGKAKIPADRMETSNGEERRSVGTPHGKMTPVKASMRRMGMLGGLDLAMHQFLERDSLSPEDDS